MSASASINGGTAPGVYMSDSITGAVTARLSARGSAGRLGRLEFAQTPLQFGDPRVGTFEDALLDLEVVPGDQVEAVEERPKEGAQIPLDVAGGRMRKHF